MRTSAIILTALALALAVCGLWWAALGLGVAILLAWTADGAETVTVSEINRCLLVTWKGKRA